MLGIFRSLKLVQKEEHICNNWTTVSADTCYMVLKCGLVHMLGLLQSINIDLILLGMVQFCPVAPFQLGMVQLSSVVSFLLAFCS